MDSLLLFFSQAEWYAMLAGLLLGMGATEMTKRLMRFIASAEPRWLYPAVGYVVTFFCAFAIWPGDGRFAHPFVAAAIVALFAPMIYALMIAGLRRAGLGWVADIISGRKAEPVAVTKRRRG